MWFPININLLKTPEQTKKGYKVSVAMRNILAHLNTVTRQFFSETQLILFFEKKWDSKSVDMLSPE